MVLIGSYTSPNETSYFCVKVIDNKIYTGELHGIWFWTRENQMDNLSTLL
jgi:hypothetical protein